MLSIGRSNYMRFNHPAEAKQLRSVLPHSRISMAPISFSLPDSQLQENYHLERKPPVAPRKSPRNSCSDEEMGFLGKLTKFEMLSKQNRNNCVSPKVFPAGAITTNVPADQILGHSRSSSLISLKNSSNNNSPLQNLTNLERNCSNTPSFNSSSPGHLFNTSSQGSCFISSSPNYCSDENRQRTEIRPASRSSTPSHQYQNISSPNHNQIQMYSTAESYLKTYKPYYRDNNNENNNQNQTTSKNNVNQAELMSRSFTCQRSTDLDDLRDFDMSQSLIVTKTTTTEYLQLEKFGSNPNICNSPNGNFCGANLRSVGGAQGFGSNPNIKRIQPPSPAFNRNPKYNEPKRGFGRVKSPTPSTGSGCSLEELRERQIDAENKRREAENKRKQAQEERLREQEVERQEKMRLEEILAMCAEYERQSTVEKPRQPNRWMGYLHARRLELDTESFTLLIRRPRLLMRYVVCIIRRNCKTLLLF